MLTPHHKHVYDKFIIVAPNWRVGVCHMEAEEAIIGIPTSVCQPALSELTKRAPSVSNPTSLTFFLFFRGL